MFILYDNGKKNIYIIFIILLFISIKIDNSTL